LIIINTCAVTGRTEAKVRKKIRSRLRNHPGSRLILTGCGVSYSQLAGENIIHSIPPERRGQFPPAVRKRSGEGISFFEGHHRAFLKIQDGCDSYCSYCIIPYLRGKSRSRPRSSIIEEIWRLRQRGYREIVLTGIHLGKYGEDFNPPSSLQELAGALPEGEEGCFRYRLSSIEPGEITDDLLEMIYQ